MQLRNYRLTVIGCALSWLLAGLHLPTLHEVLDHGYSPEPTVLVLTLLLAAAGVGFVWALLRAPASSERVSDTTASS